MAGLPRPKNIELLQYGKMLDIIDLRLRKDVVVVFYMFSKLEYSSTPISEEEAFDTIDRIRNIREYIYNMLNEASELPDDDNEIMENL